MKQLNKKRAFSLVVMIVVVMIFCFLGTIAFISSQLEQNNSYNIINKSHAYVDDSLVGYWDMETLTSDGKLHDLSGNGNMGTIVGNPSVENGFLGSGLRFDGINDYVSIPQEGALDISGEITIMIGGNS